MFEQIKANIKTNFKFYARNKMLIGVVIVLVFIFAVSALPAYFLNSEGRHLGNIHMIFSRMSFFATIATSLLGLLVASHHITNRSVKMVFTKPCTPDIWLLSCFLSAIILSTLMFLVIFAVTWVMSTTWAVPFQWEILFMTIHNFSKAITWMSYIMLVGMFLHPVLTVLFVLIINEFTFAWLKLIPTGNSGGSKVFSFIADAGYMIMPSYQMFSEEMGYRANSFNIAQSGWQYLGLSVGYTAALTILCYLLSICLIRRKRLI